MINNRPILLYDWLPVVALCVAIFVQACYPAPPTGPDFPLKDKLLHAAAYGLLAVLCGRACRHTWAGRLTRRQLLIISICLATLYGVSDEWHQSYVAGRQADVMDVVADFAGSVLGAVIYIRIRRPAETSDPSTL